MRTVLVPFLACVLAFPLSALAFPLSSPGAIAHLTGAPLLGLWAPKKVTKPAPKPKPTPTPSVAPTPSPTPPPPPPPPEKPAEKTPAKVEFAACPTESLQELEAAALETFVRKRCRNLRVPSGAAPTEIGNDEMLVAICVRDKEAIETQECGLKGHVQLASGENGPGSVTLVADGELAISLKTSKIEKLASPSNGTAMTLVVVTSAASGGDDGKTARSPLVWRRAQDPYGHGAYIWFPLPMLTTDFSASPSGYRLGVTPLAVAAGTRFYPSPTSHAYFGVSAFVAWNLLVPNDTQTLSNGTTVRINYKAFGLGVLLDAAGYVSIGVGLGHTFTSDARTDFRTWIYFGPRLLGALTDF